MGIVNLRAAGVDPTLDIEPNSGHVEKLDNMIVINAYLRRPAGALKRGHAAVELTEVRGARCIWTLHGTIIELGVPRHAEIVDENPLDDGPAMELAPLIIPAGELVRMARIEEAYRAARFADECHGYDLDGNPLGAP